MRSISVATAEILDSGATLHSQTVHLSRELFTELLKQVLTPAWATGTLALEARRRCGTAPLIV
jgi:hypothetical protein